jgi:hypothetical protein
VVDLVDLVGQEAEVDSMAPHQALAIPLSVAGHSRHLLDHHQYQKSFEYQTSQIERWYYK